MPCTLAIGAEYDAASVALDDLQFRVFAHAGRDDPGLERVAPADAERTIETIAAVVMTSQHEGHDGRRAKVDFMAVFVAGDQIDRIAGAGCHPAGAHTGCFVGKIAD